MKVRSCLIGSWWMRVTGIESLVIKNNWWSLGSNELQTSCTHKKKLWSFSGNRHSKHGMSIQNHYGHWYTYFISVKTNDNINSASQLWPGKRILVWTEVARKVKEIRDASDNTFWWESRLKKCARVMKGD